MGRKEVYMELLARKDVPVEQTWDLSLIFPNESSMWEALEQLKTAVKGFVEAYAGNLNEAETIVRCLDEQEQLYLPMSRLWQYAGLALEADYTDNALREREAKVSDELTRLESDMAFVDSEILLAPDGELKAAVELAKGCRRYLRDLMAKKAHMLSPETEKVLTALSISLETPYEVYNTMKLADISFEPFTVEGKEYPLGYSLFEDNYELEANTAVRRAAFRAFSDTLKRYQNTTAAAYNACVSTEKTLSELRKFDNVFDSLLFEQKVTREMYDRQIDVITERLAPHMRKYARLLQKKYGLEKMTFADLKIAVDPEYDPKVTIEESHRYVREALSILGEDYVDMVDRAYRERWIDFARNVGKSTGGFCSGIYRQNSFILLNWNDRMADVFTVAHELGHAGQSMYSDRAQSYYDDDPSMYLIEAPSTMNELLLAHYLTHTKEDKRLRRWVLSSLISNTYYHNFVTHLREAWYQREVYRIIDEGGSVNAEILSDLFRKNLELFWGDAVEIPEGAELTWMRQPHYYMGLYPYTYSAGLTVATQAMLRIEQEGAPAVSDWKRFLSAGGTQDPAGLAKLAGVDVTTEDPLNATIDYIGSLIDEICRLTEELDGILL
jgi:oligoendopeptidase F